MEKEIDGVKLVYNDRSISHALISKQGCIKQFVLQHGHSRELQLFPHIRETGTKKNIFIQLNSLPVTTSDCIRIYYIIDGKFEWYIHQKPYLLFPGDVAVILPGQEFGGTKDYLEIGTVSWMHLKLQYPENGRKISTGEWSRLTEGERMTIERILLLSSCPLLSNLKVAGGIIQNIQNEFVDKEIGYAARINHLTDELFILLARQLMRQTNSSRDFPQTFMQLEQTLRGNLSHQWTVEEMAALVGLGITAFSEKVKSFTGFSPLNYLINIRISEAIKLLKRPGAQITDIALDVGFYSSQHFSTTFKKLTAYTPSEFRKRNCSAT